MISVLLKMAAWFCHKVSHDLFVQSNHEHFKCIEIILAASSVNKILILFVISFNYSSCDASSSFLGALSRPRLAVQCGKWLLTDRRWRTHIETEIFHICLMIPRNNLTILKGTLRSQFSLGQRPLFKGCVGKHSLSFCIVKTNIYSVEMCGKCP